MWDKKSFLIKRPSLYPEIETCMIICCALYSLLRSGRSQRCMRTSIKRMWHASQISERVTLCPLSLPFSFFQIFGHESVCYWSSDGFSHFRSLKNKIKNVSFFICEKFFLNPLLCLSPRAQVAWEISHTLELRLGWCLAMS